MKVFSFVLVAAFSFLSTRQAYAVCEVSHVAGSDWSVANGAAAVTQALSGAQSILAGQDVIISVAVRDNIGGKPVTAIKDSGGNVYSNPVSINNGVSGEPALYMWYVHATANASSITILSSNTGNWVVSVSQYSNSQGLGNVLTSNIGTTGPSTMVSGSLNNGDIEVTGFAGNGNTSISAVTGNLETNGSTGSAGTNADGAIVDNTPVGYGPVTMAISTNHTKWYAGELQLLSSCATPTPTNTPITCNPYFVSGSNKEIEPTGD